MAIQIQFRRGTASEWASVNPILAEAEMGIEIDTQLFKIGNGVQNWNSLPYGGVRGFTGSIGFVGSAGVGNIAVQNVLYVSKSGNDSYNGLNLTTSKLTIESALSIATTGTTIFVKSGDYTENNPLVVPEGVAIVGDNLRTVTVRPANKTLDLFWVTNGVYLEQMTFKDHEAPAAAVAFPSDSTQGTVIHTSPYVQNCTSMTTTGTGMRVDGAHVNGLRSMVVDAFTQYNQGGIGIHMLNQGNTQLVSVFTICCDIGFLCESGGFCSVTNSNSSFGNYALKADGVSTPLYTAKTIGATSGDTFTLDNLLAKPNIGDAVRFAGDETYYTVATATAIKSANTDITYPNFNNEPADAKNTRQTILDAKSKIQTDVIDFLNETYVTFDFNQFKATRDAGIVIDAVVDDMIFGTNYKSVLAGKAYYRASGAYLLANQKTETVASLNFLKTQVLELISSDSSQGPEYQRINSNLTTIIDILNNGVGVAPSVTYATPTGVNQNKVKAKDILQANKNFLTEEGIAYITQTYDSFTYDDTTCARDLGYIIDGVIYDIQLGTNFNSIYNGLSYRRAMASAVINDQLPQTVGALEFARDEAATSVQGNATAEYRNIISWDEVVDIVKNGVASANTLTWTDNGDTGSTNSRIQLQTNKTFIVNEVIAWINSNYPSLTYDQTVCARDLGYIIDAVSYDVQYGGDSATQMAARAYFDGAVSVLPSGQKAATAAAFTELQDIIGKIILESYPGQDINNPIGSTAEQSEAEGLVQIIIDVITADNLSALPATVTYPTVTWVATGIKSAANRLATDKSTIIADTITYINDNFVNFTYNATKCRSDINFIVDAITYDALYGGNSQTADAADEYYSGGYLVIPGAQRLITSDTYNYIKTVAQACIVNTAVTPLNNSVTQNTSLPAATSTEATLVGSLFNVVINLIENAYSSTITLEESVLGTILDNANVSFHQYSLITSSGHTFEWIGAGTNVNTALPYLGGTPITENQVIEVNGGRVYYTGTDQRGDFRIGNDLVINRNTGTISGRTFTKSLFAVMTPYILAIGD
jgi:hypothetical protein